MNGSYSQLELKKQSICSVKACRGMCDTEEKYECILRRLKINIKSLSSAINAFVRVLEQILKNYQQMLISCWYLQETVPRKGFGLVWFGFFKEDPSTLRFLWKGSAAAASKALPADLLWERMGSGVEVRGDCCWEIRPFIILWCTRLFWFWNVQIRLRKFIYVQAKFKLFLYIDA